MYQIYATLKDWYGLKMRIFVTDIDLLSMQIFRNEFYKELLDMPQLRRLFAFSDISANQQSCLGTPEDSNRGKFGFFIDDT